MVVLVDSCCFRSRRVLGRLIAKDHAWERKKPFYATTKVSTLANFEVGRLIKKKKIEKSVV